DEFERRGFRAQDLAGVAQAVRFVGKGSIRMDLQRHERVLASADREPAFRAGEQSDYSGSARKCNRSAKRHRPLSKLGKLRARIAWKCVHHTRQYTSPSAPAVDLPPALVAS